MSDPCEQMLHCEHPESDVEHHERQINDDTRATERLCGDCGAHLGWDGVSDG
jgi:hypothetical protein